MRKVNAKNSSADRIKGKIEEHSGLGIESRLSPGGEISTSAFLKNTSFDDIMLTQKDIEVVSDSMCTGAHGIAVPRDYIKSRRYSR